MKACSNCGEQNKDDAIFCVGCGQNNFNQMQQQQYQPQYQQQYQQPPKKKKKALKVILIVLGAIIALAIIGNLIDGSPSDADTSTTTAASLDAGNVTEDIAENVEATEIETEATTVEVTTVETTTEETTTETTLSDEEMKEVIENQRQFYQDVEYKEAARNPNNYLNEMIKITGTVIQVLEDDVMPEYRIAQNDDYDAVWYVSFVRIADGPRILEDDTVTVYGIGSGLITYESTMGASISIPGMSSMDIEIIE